MNDQDILKKIKQEARRHEPSLAHFIHTRFDNPPPLKPKSSFPWTWLSFGTLVTSLVVIMIAINNANVNPSITSSTDSSSSETTSIPSSEVVNPPLPLADRQPLSIAVVSTSSLLPSFNQPNEPARKYMRNDRVTEEEFDLALDSITPYLPVVEQIISEQGAPSITTYEVTVGHPYFGVYSYVDMIESLNLTGTLIRYELYYNVFPLNDTTVLSEDNFKIRGLMVINNDTYGLIGSKESDDEETILQFSTFVILGFDDDQLPILDEGNFVFTRYVFSEEETRYRIIRFQDRLAVSSSWLKIEMEDEEIKIVIDLEDETMNSTFAFKYEQEDDDDEDEDEPTSYAKLDVRFEIEKVGEEKLKGRLRIMIVVDDLGNFVYRLRVTEGDYKDREKDEDRPHHDEDDD